MHGLVVSQSDTTEIKLFRKPDADFVRQAFAGIKAQDLDGAMGLTDFQTKEQFIDEFIREWAPNLGEFFWGASLNGRPVVIAGAMETEPSVFEIWLFTTDEVSKIRFPFARYIKTVIIPLLKAAGATRLYTKTVADYDIALRWLDYLGAKRETVLRQHGKNGKDYHVYVW